MALEQTFRQGALSSTYNPDAAEVVLGSYLPGSSNSYEAVAQARGATYFSVSDWDAVQGQLGANQMWNINRAFLDQQMAQGKTFVFTSNPELVNPRSYTYLEYTYLRNAGYQLESMPGGMFRAVKK